MRRTLTPLLMIALLAAAVGVALAQAEPARAAKPVLQLTEEEAAALRQAQDLQKELRIARLELALAEAKELPEAEIAARAETMYRLQGQLYAFRAKHPELARQVREQRAQHRWGRRGGRGFGQGMGRGRGHGPRGMGRGRGHGHHGMGHGGHDAWGMGPGMGPGQGHPGHGMGPGMHQGAGRGRGHGAMGGRGTGRGRERGGPGMGLGPGPGPEQGLRMRDLESLHLAPGFLPPDVEIEVVPESAD